MLKSPYYLGYESARNGVKARKCPFSKGADRDAWMRGRKDYRADGEMWKYADKAKVSS
jgi:ribosome modulation factor